MKKLLPALLLLLPLAACGSDEPAEGDAAELTILAAASLTDVFEELATGFEAEHDAEVTFSFGSSTDLAAQAVDGAPGDVLATADEISMQAAEDGGVTVEVDTFASNVLVIAAAAGNPAEIGELADLADARWVRCADEVPCGRVALAVLEDNNFTGEPVSLEDDVRATLDKVTAQEVDAGLVYATDAVSAGEAVETVEIEGADSQATFYFATALEQSTNSELAQAWVAYLTSDEGQEILDRAGFGRP